MAKKKQSKKNGYKQLSQVSITTLWVLVVGVILYGLAQHFWSKVQASENSEYSQALSANELLRVVVPDSIDNQEIEYMAYNCNFNSKLHIPNCVIYELTAQELEGEVPRVNNFRCDENVDGCPEPSDYTNSGYDRGHMAPAADFHWDIQAMRESFYMTNICPQDHNLNSKAWNKLEQKVRNWAARDSSLIVATGPILSKGMKKLKSGVAVPEKFFKVILAPKRQPMRAIAFIMPNKKCDTNLVGYSCTVDEVEKLTGLDFFSALPDDIEESVESQTSYNQWNH